MEEFNAVTCGQSKEAEPKNTRKKSIKKEGPFGTSKVDGHRRNGITYP
jgi:hypothetical protein